MRAVLDTWGQRVFGLRREKFSLPGDGLRFGVPARKHSLTTVDLVRFVLAGVLVGVLIGMAIEPMLRDLAPTPKVGVAR